MKKMTAANSYFISKLHQRLQTSSPASWIQPADMFGLACRVFEENWVQHLKMDGFHIFRMPNVLLLEGNGKL